MRKIRAYLLLILFSLSSVSFATEPANIALSKQALIQYYDSGEYTKDINGVINNAMQYLKSRVAQRSFGGLKPAIVLDIDETALSNYPALRKLNFGGTHDEIEQYEIQGNDPVINSTLKLYKYAKANHIAVFFITGRHDYEREATIKNLNNVGYEDFDGLFLRTAKHQSTPAAIYKTEIRKDLATQGYNILLNIGDQHSDLAGGYADKVFKLPNPYYLIS